MTQSTSILDNLRSPVEMVPSSFMGTRNFTLKSPPAQTEWFIKGPIPGTWMLRVLSLNGNFTINVALTIWYVSGVTGTQKEIPLERFHLDRFGVKKDSARRALQRLQEAGLITYRKSGQKFLVTIIDVVPS